MQVVLAVKNLQQAKSRLADLLDAQGRASLVLAMLRDTLAVAGRSEQVSGVHVVTRDDTVAAVAHDNGAVVLADPPVEGLNPALSHAAETLGARSVVALQPDLPALRPRELDAALAAGGRGRWCVADRTGTGTTLLGAVGDELRPEFGDGSAARHAASGAHGLPGDWPGLRCDVDTLDDLAEAVRLGVGPATAGVLRDWGTAATVAEHDADAARLFTDAGDALQCGPEAIRRGGWRRLRPGQRVRAYRDVGGTIVLLTTAALRAPE